jgi:hypothetical protein
MVRIPDDDDGENLKSKRSLPQTVAPKQSILLSNISASDIEQANQTLTARLGRALTEIETAEALHIGPRASGQILEYDDLDIGTEYVALSDRLGEDGLAYLPTERESIPLFPSRTGGTQQTPRCLQQAIAPPQSIPAWHVSAPDIERAIQTLSAKLGRAPTQIEIAEELRIDLITYWQVLSYLKDLRIGMLYTARTADSGEEELVYLPNGPEDDVLCRCLRSEMQDLLMDAICNLPARERLVITFYYYESMDDKEISLTLNIAEATVSTIRTSVRLHLRASLASSMLSEQLRDPCAHHTRTSSAEESDTGTQFRNEEAAHVVVSASQSGWLPKGHSWERFGEQASWYRDIRSWYSLNDEHELTQIRRNEDYHLKLEL